MLRHRSPGLIAMFSLTMLLAAAFSPDVVASSWSPGVAALQVADTAGPAPLVPQFAIELPSVVEGVVLIENAANSALRIASRDSVPTTSLDLVRTVELEPDTRPTSRTSLIWIYELREPAAPSGRASEPPNTRHDSNSSVRDAPVTRWPVTGA